MAIKRRRKRKKDRRIRGTGTANSGKRKFKGFVLLLTGLIFLVYSVLFLERVVKPTVVDLGQIKARSMVTEMIAKSVKEAFDDASDVEEILTIQNDDSGKVSMVQTNAAAATRLNTDLGAHLEQKMDSMEPERITIPLGTLFGSPFLSQTGPKVRIRVETLGAVKVSLKTEFEESGINQTKYKVYLDVSSMVRVVAPFSESDLDVSNSYLVAEVVIVGDVPETYIIVPEEDVLDALY